MYIDFKIIVINSNYSLVSRIVMLLITRFHKYTKGMNMKISNFLFSTISNNTSRLFKEEINMLYDSKCNLCLMEVNFLAKKDIYGKIRFTDIEDIKYDSSNVVNGKIDYATAMTSIHAIKANGEIIRGVQVFYELYNVIGYGWLYSFIKIPLLKSISEYIYVYWAKYRTDLTRGQSLNKLIQQRNELLQSKLNTISNNNDSSCNQQSCSSMKNI